MKAFRVATVVLVLLFSVIIGWISYWNENDIMPVYGDSDGEKNGFVYVKAEESEDGYSTIYVPSGENIRILTLTDPQVKYPFNNYETLYGASNEDTYVFVERLVKAADPDLVVITGDIVMSQFTNNLKYLKRWANLFEELDVYWAPTFGNHDSEFTIGSGKIAEGGLTKLYSGPCPPAERLRLFLPLLLQGIWLHLSISLQVFSLDVLCRL